MTLMLTDPWVCQVLAWLFPDDSRGGDFNQNAGRITIQVDHLSGNGMQKKRPHEAAVFPETSEGSMILLGVVCSVFRVVGSVFRSVSSLVSLVGSVGGSVLRLVGGVAVVGVRCGGSSAGSLLGLSSRLAGSVSRSVGLVSSLHRFRGGSLRSSLLCGISSLLSRISGLLGVLRGILRAVAACRQQRDERGGE
jgi:hypothetical protein